MRILLISDIHGNLTALEAVLKKAGEYDSVWCLGDIVGYGPNPNECIQLIKEQPGLKCVLGNHDAAAIEIIGSEAFNPSARTSCHWTRKELTDESKEFLLSLPEKIKTKFGVLVHGSLNDHIVEYLLDTEKAKMNFGLFGGDLCLVGHTHLPMYFREHPDGLIEERFIREDSLKVHLEDRMICNPGSVGQPRDHNPRASFAVVNTDVMTITYQRVKYDVEKTKLRMAHHKLPLRHITRLEFGW